MGSMYAIDSEDGIVKCLQKGTESEWINSWQNLVNLPVDNPVIFRSMSQRKTVAICEKQGRDYYYIDTGYIGNLDKRKDWHRIVKNGMQHSNFRYDLPDDRFNILIGNRSHLRFQGWKKAGDAILVVTPSEKPCKFYGINRDEWVENTITQLKQNTDRPIIIRDKAPRRGRIRNNSIYHQFTQDNIFAVVTYNSIAATEAIGFGIPCFTLAPNAADPFCLKDLSQIETPLYENEEKVIKWQNWLAYCQFTPKEMGDGTAMKIIKEYDIR
jgi:hypothetical protein